VEPKGLVGSSKRRRREACKGVAVVTDVI